MHVADYLAAHRALVREMRESRLGRDEKLAQAWRQARKLRTEEDVVLAEELFPAIQFDSSALVGQALGRMLAHEARTGHQVRQMLRPR